MITMSAGPAKAQIVPEMGGGLAGLWVHGVPVLRPWSGQVEEGPFSLACNLLVPFSNRISGGGFDFAGRRYAVQPNLPGEPFPIHGDGFQRVWTVAFADLDQVELVLQDGNIGPYSYTATASYRMTERSLRIVLSVTNLGRGPLPFGVGLHPWFPRSEETRLTFSAAGYWPETSKHLPATTEAVALGDGATWREGAALPATWINQGFSGWDGTAQIAQGNGAVGVRLKAWGLNTAILYSPSASADFFCFEPVSHPVDAHNLPGQPGLVRLAPSQFLTVAMQLDWGPGA